MPEMYIVGCVCGDTQFQGRSVWWTFHVRDGRLLLVTNSHSRDQCEIGHTWAFHGSSVILFHCFTYAVPACTQGFYLPSFCLPGLFNFILSTFLQSSMVECVLIGESELLLVVGIHFVSPCYDPSRLTGCKTSSIYLQIYPRDMCLQTYKLVVVL